MGYGLLLVYIVVLFIRPMEWVPGMTGMPLVNIVAILTIMATALMAPQSGWRFRSAPQNGLMLGFFAAILMSHISHTFFGALTGALQEFGKIVILYFLIVLNVNTVKRLKGLIAVLILGALFLALHGTLQWHYGSGFGGQFPIFDRGVARVVGFGFFNDPNDMALMMLTVLPFLLSGVHREGRNGLGRIVSLAAVGLVCYCVFRTNSRGGWLAMGAMLTAYFVVNFAARKKTAVVVGVCAVAAMFVLGPSRMGGTSATESSARGRLIAWTSGNVMLKRWPVFGAGEGRFLEFAEDGKVAHNSFVHCYAELGLFGYFFWLALLGSSLKDAYVIGRQPKRPPVTQEDDEDQRQLKRIAQAGTASLVGYMAGAFFLSRTYIVPLYVLFALFASLRAIHDARFGAAPGLFEKRDLKYVLAGTLGTIPAVYVLLRVTL